MESQGTITLTKGQSKAVFDLSKGGKLKTLVLTDAKTKKTHVVVNDQTTDANFDLGGSWFLFPYVNRLPDENIDFKDRKLTIDPPQRDSNGIPIHGFYTKTARKVVQKAENILELTTTDDYKPYANEFPNFVEKFILEEDRLHVENVFSGDDDTKKYPLYFAYGYHPYFTVDNRKIDELVLTTNVQNGVELEKKSLLPVLKEGKVNLEPLSNYFKSGEVFGATKLDSLFYFDAKKAGPEEPFFRLTDPDTKVGVEVTSNISNERKNVNLDWWQIYTPDSRNSIAIEPMTSPGNPFNVDFPHNIVTIKDKTEIKDGNWEIRLISSA